jgi:pheromone shutdown-related protein TraB
MKEKIDENIVLVGTSHVSDESVEEIESTVEEEDPHLVGVELDSSRYNKLIKELNEDEVTEEDDASFRQAITDPIAFLLSSIQSSLSSITKNEPGIDMKTAIQKGKDNDSSILLLDRDISRTLKRINSKMGKKEKIKMLSTIVASIVYLNYKKIRGETDKMKEKATEVKNPSSFKQKLSEYSPNLAKVLIDERDYYMAKKIIKISEANPEMKIVAVVGAGHLEGIKEYLNNPEEMPSSMEEI